MRISTLSGRVLGTLVAAVAIAIFVGPAAALDEVANEKEVLKDCEKKLCGILVKKEPTGADLSCALTKTWAKDKIKEGIEKKKISWSLGDARCAVELAMPRATLVNAVSKPAHTIEFASHTIKCQVERESEVTPISVTVQPKIEFKDGKAVKAFLGLKTIEAPAVVKGAIWTVATLEDTVGVFHGDIISEVNEFISSKCPKALAAQ